MRILVDQNAPRKYVEQLRRDDGLTVITVEEALRHDATDAKIAQFAESKGWVVFTPDLG